MSTEPPNLVSYEIEDDLSAADRRAIEVLVHLDDGQDRWCFFITPSALLECGDWLPGTQTRFHLGSPHMIVVAEMGEHIVRSVLEELDRTGELENHTLAIEPP